MLHYRRRGAGLVQGEAQELQPPSELTSHDGMRRMRLAERPASVLNPRAEVPCRQLILLVLDPLTIDVSKEKSDHGVPEHAVHEAVDDASQHGLTPQLLEQ